MTTPFTAVIVRDSFTRANSGTLGSNWTAESSSADTVIIGITSNSAQVQTTGGNGASFWNANTFKADQYAQCIIVASAVGSGAQVAGPVVRATPGGNYYRLVGETNNTGANIFLQSNVSGTISTLGTATSAIASGDLFRLEVVGSRLTAYKNGTQVIQLTDTSLTTGAPGVAGFMAAASPTVGLTNWEGGNLLWTRQGTVIPITGNGNQEPSVIYEANPKILSANADGKIWKMWYSTGWTSPVPTINYAESADGITWTQYSSNPVISDGANGVVHGSVLHVGSTYYGFFGNNASATAINRWTSSDGVTWVKANSNVLTTGVGWDSANIDNPIISVSGTTWNMLYEGRSSVLSSVGLATSTDSGVTWTKYVSNPVITSASMSFSMGKTPLILNGSLYYLWTHGTLANSNLPSDILIFSSPDLHTWTAGSKNPVYERVLANEGANVPSAGQVADPCLVELNGTYQFYSATSVQAAGNFHINLATAPFTILQALGMIIGNSIIAGNVGIAGATVSYSGAASGSVMADSAGNYVIPVLTNGAYTITPSLAGHTFTPASQSQTASGADITGVNFASVLAALGQLAVTFTDNSSTVLTVPKGMTADQLIEGIMAQERFYDAANAKWWPVAQIKSITRGT